MEGKTVKNLLMTLAKYLLNGLYIIAKPLLFVIRPIGLVLAFIIAMSWLAPILNLAWNTFDWVIFLIFIVFSGLFWGSNFLLANLYDEISFWDN